MQSAEDDGAHNHSAHPSRLSDDHVRHLLARGLTHATIEAAGLWSANSAQVTDILGFTAKSGGIVIPYYHPFTGHIVLNRVRPDTLHSSTARQQSISLTKDTTSSHYAEA